ncbi:MAG: Gfo/Idh/MocA family oxidoreductase [Microbacterium sp.]
MSAPVGIGFIGVGVISDTYLENLSSFPDVRVVILGDLDQDRARSQAEKHGVPLWGTSEDVLGHPDVELVVNLTTPDAHIAVSATAVAAGKHVWTEKPLGLDRVGAAALLQQAAEVGVRVGSAPDTILGPGFQTAKRAIQSGVIGTPLFAQTQFQTQGPDAWHPNPAFLFAQGAGPLLDMGPYYFSALVSLFGSADRVSALGSKPRAERAPHVGPLAGQAFPVEVPTTVSVLVGFEAGQQSQSMLSFDSALERHGVLEIHGTEGSIVLPDPNRFEGGSAYVRPMSQLADGFELTQEWIDIEQEGVGPGRGIGVIDMVRAIAEGRPHVASGELGYHVLDIMLSASESAAAGGQSVRVESTVDPVPTVAVDFDPFARS